MALCSATGAPQRGYILRASEHAASLRSLRGAVAWCSRANPKHTHSGNTQTHGAQMHTPLFTGVCTSTLGLAWHTYRKSVPPWNLKSESAAVGEGSEQPRWTTFAVNDGRSHQPNAQAWTYQDKPDYSRANARQRCRQSTPRLAHGFRYTSLLVHTSTVGLALHTYLKSVPPWNLKSESATVEEGTENPRWATLRSE